MPKFHTANYKRSEAAERYPSENKRFEKRTREMTPYTKVHPFTYYFADKNVRPEEL